MSTHPSSADLPGGTSPQPTSAPDPAGAQTVPLQRPQPALPPSFPPGWPAPGYPPAYMPMALPPGWPPGYPPPQMPGYPLGYPGMPAAYPLPPIAPHASPVAQQAARSVPIAVAAMSEPVPMAEPVNQPASPPTPSKAPRAETAPSPEPAPIANAALAEPEVLAVATDEFGLAPVFRPSSSSTSVREPNRFIQLWRKMGVGSLILSLGIHGALLALAGIVALTVTLQEKQVDFLPGGGTQQAAKASAALSEQVQVKARKKLSKTLPRSRIVTDSISSSVVLPDAPMDAIDVPDMSSVLGSGRLASAGYGLGGAGGGFGNGLGKGALSGVTFKPLMMFGIELKDTRKIAVVMDVSRSMTRYLPIVVKELDKVAKGSPVVMYFGCGLSKAPARRSDVDDKVRKTDGEDFACFWQNWQGTAAVNLTAEERKKLRYDPAQPMPLNDIYQMMSKRPSTYYINFQGIGYAWTALMSNEVKNADAVYWFADFQDHVDEEQMEVIRRRFKARKQKLFIHASTRGNSFELVRDNLVTPLGGEVIETELPKK